MQRILKICILAVTCMFGTFNVSAETVSRKDAATIAELFFNAARGQKMAAPNFTFTGREFTTNRLFIPFYVFNHPTGGYVVISAENKAWPILAYSLTGKLEAGRLSAGQKALFNIYGRHIEFIRYDSEPTPQVIKAWGDLQHHIAGILSAQLDVTDLLEPWEDVAEAVDAIRDRANVNDLSSANYTPEQWVDQVTDELQMQRNVSLGFISPTGDVLPAVATGRRADFFRLRFSEQPSDGMYRLLATELISQGELAILSKPFGATASTAAEEIPFTFYDTFIEELQRDSMQRRAAIDESLLPTSPVVQWEGSGRFSVWLPENVMQAIVFNVAGMRVQESTYRDTMMADIDISAQPAGFYIAILRGESGTPYSLRLYR